MIIDSESVKVSPLKISKSYDKSEVLLLEKNYIATSNGLWAKNHGEKIFSEPIISNTLEPWILTLLWASNEMKDTMLLTCSNDSAFLWTNVLEVSPNAPIVLAEEMCEISAAAFNCKGNLLALALPNSKETWILNLNFEGHHQLISSKIFAILESGPVGSDGLKFVKVDQIELLITVISSCQQSEKVILWNLETLECVTQVPTSIFPSLNIRQFPICSTTIVEPFILLGSTNGHIYVLEIIAENDALRTVRDINVGIAFNPNIEQVEPQNQNAPRVKTVKSKLQTNIEEIEHLQGQLVEGGTVDIGCEVLSIVLIDYSESKLIIVGTSLGIAVVEMSSGEILQTLFLSELLQTSQYSALALNFKLNILEQTEDKLKLEGIFRTVSSQSNHVLTFELTNQDKNSIITACSVFATQPLILDGILNKSRREVTGKSQLPKQKKIKSSQYGSKPPRQKMFMPIINKPPKSSKEIKSGIPSTNKGKWSNKVLHKEETPNILRSRGLSDKSVPKNLCSTFKVTDANSARINVNFSKNRKESQMLFVTASREPAIQVYQVSDMKNTKNTKVSHTLSGHTNDISSLDVSFCNKYLVSSSADKTVKIWDMQKKSLILDIAGNHKASPDLAYGKIPLKKMPIVKKCFPETVIKSQFFFLDQFLLSTSSNKLFVHQLELDSNPSFIFKKSFKLNGCKIINDLSAINNFYSYLVLCLGSDKSLRVLDLNQQKICLETSALHSKTVHSIRQPKNCELQDSDSEMFNLFATSSYGDGANLWDLRTGGSKCVQKFEWPSSSSGRLAGGLEFSPGLQNLAVGAEDGNVYIFDTRKTKSFVDKISNSNCNSIVTDLSFNLNMSLFACAKQNGQVSIYKQ